MMLPFLQTLCLAAITWSPPQPITNSVTNGAYSLAYDSGTNQVFAGWTDTDAGDLPVSSFYTAGADWSAEKDISNQPVVDAANVPNMYPILAYHGQLQEMFATWSAKGFSRPFYSIYNGTSWSSQSSVSTMFTNTLVNEVYVDALGQLFAVWGNGPVYYAIYDPITSSWGTTGTISGGSNVASEISLVYDASSSQLIAVWSAGSLMASNITYSIYLGGSWSSPQAIAGATSSNRPEIGVAYNSATGLAYAAWNDMTTGYPIYSFYNGTTWSAPAFIVQTSQPIFDVSLVYDPNDMQLIAAWIDSATKLPQYSVLPDGSSTWSAATPFPGASPAGWNIRTSEPTGVALVYDPGLGKVFAGWADGSTGYPIWTFTGPPVPFFISGLSGKRLSDQFLLQKELINVISWQTNYSTITGYEIYRDGQLIAVLGPSAKSFVDHNQLNRSTIYTVVANGPNNSRQSLSVVIN